LVHHDWRDAARAIKQTLEPLDAEQRALAQRLGIDLPDGVPARVAAAMIARHLAAPLRLGPDRPMSLAQREFLDDLLTELEFDEPESATTYDLTSAWLDVLTALRALRALERERPKRGDYVEDTARRLATPEVLSSISDDGVIYLAGPGNQRIPAYRLHVVARASDTRPEANELRRKAANARARRAKLVTPPSGPQLAALGPYRVKEGPEHPQIELLRKAIDVALDEKPVQRVIEEHPALLAGLTQSSWGTWVRPQISLGGDLYPDFLVAAADSSGVHWTLVELESPRAERVGMANGQFGESARKGINQIEDWRNWLTENLAFARDNRGLVGIRPESPGMVIVGRRLQGAWPSLPTRRRLFEDREIVLHSYDWLVEALEHGAGVARPGGPLDWPDWQLRD
jgi:Domain of unknown function (DUF4263)